MSSPVAQNKSAYPSPARAWYGVGVLMLAYTLSFIDRYVIALLIEPIKQDLVLTDTQIGLLSGLAFAIFYTTLGIPIGRLADRYDRRRIISIGILAWSLMTTACGFARGFWQLFAARVGVGVGEAALSPAAFSLIADSFTAERLGRALSVYSAGVYLGAGLAFIIGGAVIQLVLNTPAVDLPLIGTVTAWQLTFIYVGLPGMLVSLWIFTIKEPGRRNIGQASAAAGIPIGQVLRFMGSCWRAYAAHFLGFSLLVLVFNVLIIWSPAFLDRVHGLSASEAGYSLGLIIAVFGSAGIIAGGWLADVLGKRGYTDATMRTGIVAAIGLTPFVVVLPFVPNASLTLMLYAPLMFLSSFGFGAAVAALQLITPNEMRAQVSAVYLFMINLIGIGIGPSLTGWITDTLFADEAAVGFSIALVAGISAPVAALILWSGLGQYRQRRMSIAG
jgi:MFS family permease